MLERPAGMNSRLCGLSQARGQEVSGEGEKQPDEPKPPAEAAEIGSAEKPQEHMLLSVATFLFLTLVPLDLTEPEIYQSAQQYLTSPQSRVTHSLD